MSSFYDRVHYFVRQIPRSKVTTYGMIAALCGKPLAARAVGYALRALPPETDVPSQRVINKQGKVSPRAGHDRGEPEIQQVLLEREGIMFDADRRIDLRRFAWEGASINAATRLAVGLSLLVATPALAAPATDLTGAWTPTADAQPGPVRILDCWPNYNHYTITRGAGGQWNMKVRQIHHGGASLAALHEESLQGTFAAGRLRLAGQAGLVWASLEGVIRAGLPTSYPVPPKRTVYDLRLNAKTGHLVGTRDGTPIRLARLALYKPVDRDCGPPPP